MRVKVFQVNKENFREFGFMDYEFFKAHGCEKMRRDIYKLVFDGDLKSDTLEGVFEECNLSCPDGYKGHSMSVSDLVQCDYGLFFCDSFGFKKVEWSPTEWDSEKYKVIKPKNEEELREANNYGFFRNNYEYKLVYKSNSCGWVSLRRREIGKRRFSDFDGFTALDCKTTDEVIAAAYKLLEGRGV